MCDSREASLSVKDALFDGVDPSVLSAVGGFIIIDFGRIGSSAWAGLRRGRGGKGGRFLRRSSQFQREYRV